VSGVVSWPLPEHSRRWRACLHVTGRLTWRGRAGSGVGKVRWSIG
jgi:hypothetical protein